jgi:hypothetical protein
MASVSLLAAATFCACDKDEKDEKTDENSFTSLTVEVANASDYNGKIDTVKLMAIGDSGFSSATILSSAPYANGKFTITLPKVDDKLLFKWLDIDDTVKLPSNVTLSNRKVNATYTTLIGYKLGKERYILDTYLGRR